MPQIPHDLQGSMADHLQPAAKLSEADEAERKKNYALEKTQGSFKDEPLSRPPDIPWEADAPRIETNGWEGKRRKFMNDEPSIEDWLNSDIEQEKPELKLDKSPFELLNICTKKYSQIFWAAKVARLNKKFLNTKGEIKWDDSCFVPCSIWCTAFEKFLKKKESEIDNNLLYTIMTLGTWRYTQGIYEFHDELYKAIIDTKLDKEIPPEVLVRLPQWSIYIKIPAKYNDNIINGFWVTLDQATVDLQNQIVLLGHYKHGIVPLAAFPLGEKTWEQYADEDVYFDKNASDEKSKQEEILGYKSTLQNFLKLLLYICSSKSEIKSKEGDEQPKNPTPTKTRKKGYELFPASSPKIWKVGFETGEILTKAMKEENDSRERITQTQRKTHLRRAHWHLYWIGTKKENVPEEKKRHLEYRWIHPMIVRGFEKDTEPDNESNIDQ